MKTPIYMYVQLRGNIECNKNTFLHYIHVTPSDSISISHIQILCLSGKYSNSYETTSINNRLVFVGEKKDETGNIILNCIFSVIHISIQNVSCDMSNIYCVDTNISDHLKHLHAIFRHMYILTHFHQWMGGFGPLSF